MTKIVIVGDVGGCADQLLEEGAHHNPAGVVADRMVTPRSNRSARLLPDARRSPGPGACAPGCARCPGSGSCR